MTTQFKSLIQLLDYFKNEEVCREYLANQRWGETPACPHCGSTKVWKTNRGYTCAIKECSKKFSVTSGTIFENTKLSLRLWFATIYLATAHKKGISSLQLSRDLNVTQKTAWFLLHRVREMLNHNKPEMLSGTVEVDETFVGGKNKNRHASKKIANAGGRSTVDKAAVVGLLQRNGDVITYVVEDTERDTLHLIIYNHVHETARVITDAYSSYKGLNAAYAEHMTVKHTENDYKTVGDHHTNNIEGFWSLLKRGIIGIYHQISKKHLQAYCDEFAYRYNTRKITDVARFHETFKLVHNGRITYANLIAD